MLSSRNLFWLIFGLASFFLISGCGDLELEMQDTRSVVLKMNFNQRSSSRSSQITQAEVSNHKTHLIAAIPSWEQLSSNYMNYYNSYFSAELMNPAENQVSLEIPLNTQVKIFAFIFSDEYTPDQLLSGVSGVSYYGESPSFSIGTNTHNLSVGITLQSAGTDSGNGNEEDTTVTVDQGGTNNTTPFIDQVTPVTSPTSDSTPDYTFASTATGSITYGGSCSSSTTSASPGNNTITFNTLSNGTYSDCTIKITDADGNDSNTLTIPAFTVQSTTSSANTISAGNNFTCIVLDNASVKCWGYNAQGQLGIDSTTSIGDSSGEMASLTGINLAAGRTATAITGGALHTCAILDNASVKCWGYNGYGQLGIDNSTSMGDGAGEMALIPTVNLGTGRTATAVSVGYQHSCAVLDNASIKCWGRNENGQLGIDNDTVMGDGAGEMAVLPSISF